MIIGIIIGGVIEEYTNNLCLGIENMAGRDDVKCVVIPGKFIGMDYEKDYHNKYAYTYNSLFSYGLLGCFDGLIIEMSSIPMYADEGRKEHFINLFKDIPHVFVSCDSPDRSSVMINNTVGLRDALDYLYDNGARKFAMLGGPKKNVDAMERKKCFEDFLGAHGIHFQDSLYKSTSFFLDSRLDALSLIKKNPDADAYVCANDIIARHMYEALHEFDRAPGKDVSVLGFDDSDFCVCTYPTISSVRTDIVEVGKQSYKLLMETIAGRPIRQVTVPSEFILRDSIIYNKGKTDVIKDHDIDLKDIVKSNIHLEDFDDVYEESRKYMDVLNHIDEADEKDIDSIIDTLNNFCDRLFYTRFMRLIDTELFIKEVDKKYRLFLDKLKLDSSRTKLSDSYIDFLRQITKFTQTTDKHRGDTNMDYIFQMETFFRETMQFTRNTETNYSRFIENIEFLGIHNAYLYIYDNPISYVQGEIFEIPEFLNLKAVLQNGKASTVPVSAQRIEKRKAFNNDYVNWKGYERLTIFPVYAESYLYGVIVCDMDRSGFPRSEIFVNQISAAVHMHMIRTENNRILNEYEESVRTLKENNIVLDTMNKTDSLTGLNNRRGFYVRMEKLSDIAPNGKSSVLVGYLDMNDLKIINDRFGHDEGDYALKTIGSQLTDFVTLYNGFAARIGGDEFAFTVIIPRDSDLETIRNELYNAFENFNANSIKPYNVMVSIGFCLINDGEEYSVEDALIKADEDLYSEKYKKKSSVIKSAVDNYVHN